ncbi:MAG: ferrous iron transport protein B [Gemmataceae bacterium]|nr:ferrous iron transport protein B [Gemmataceae bacterium]
MTPGRPLTVALVGNPNAGKTTLFNALAGLRQRVGNYPGVTVDIHKGTWKSRHGSYDIFDLPGTYSLAARSPDEAVAVDLLLGRTPGETPPDVILAVVDASNLERHLYLATQLCELGKPVVIALNMIDVAEKQGIRIDTARLAQELGLRVVPIQANKARGLDALADAVQAAVADAPPQPVEFPAAFQDEVKSLAGQLPGVEPFLLRRLILDVGGQTETSFVQKHGESLGSTVTAARERLLAARCPIPAVEARARFGHIRSATALAVTRPERAPLTATDRLDRILTHRVWGTLVFLLVMAAVFQSIFTAASPAMDAIKAGKDWVADQVRSAMPPGPFTSLLADGIVEGVGSVVVFLPQILILFGFLAVLEDCGYMARAAFLMDKLMSRAGLSGKSFIPMLSSVACAVPGVMATRVIEQPRDRLATILVAPLMSCSARLPVYTLLTAAFLTEGRAWWVPGLTLFSMYLIGIVLAPIVAWSLKKTLLRGPTPAFVMEMPQYQWPHPKSIILRMYDRARAFLVRAGTMILAAMVLVWALLYFPAHDANGNSFDVQIHELREKAEAATGDRKEELEKEAAQLNGVWRRQSVLGRLGRAVEPVVAPLGWDWKIGMAAIASFPAREVVVGVLGQVYNLGKNDDLAEPLGNALKSATWNDEPGGTPVFTAATALSLMVFFALCCQCVSTLAVIRRETRSWRWPIFTFTYMTALAYVGALITYQVGRRFL